MTAALETRTAPESYTGVMGRLDESGDHRVWWDRHDAAEVAKAKGEFDANKRAGGTAYRMTKDGKRKEIIQEFAPDAERIVLVAPLVGG